MTKEHEQYIQTEESIQKDACDTIVSLYKEKCEVDDDSAIGFINWLINTSTARRDNAIYDDNLTAKDKIIKKHYYENILEFLYYIRTKLKMSIRTEKELGEMINWCGTITRQLDDLKIKYEEHFRENEMSSDIADLFKHPKGSK